MYQMLKRIFFSEKIMFIAVAINAIIIFLLAFPDMDYRNILLQLDVFFIFLFFLEVLVKMYELKINEYFSDKWNIFDFLITMFSLPILFWPTSMFSSILIYYFKPLFLYIFHKMQSLVLAKNFQS